MKLLGDDEYLQSKKASGLEMSTIDRYQGRDKETIVISLVRSNAQGRTGTLLEDYRRINVALSRAKKKLIIIGSLRTLQRGSAVLRPVLQNMIERKWMTTLPKNAMDVYKDPSKSRTHS